MAKPPAIWIDAHSFGTPSIEPGDGSFFGQLDVGDQLDLRMIAQRETIGFRGVDIGHVADGAGSTSAPTTAVPSAPVPPVTTT